MNSRTVLAAAVALAFILGAAAGAWYVLRERTPAFCEIDGRPIHGNMLTLATVDGKRLHACCSRCPLTLAHQAHRQIEILEVTDYVSGRRLPAAEAYFVEGSQIEVCSGPRLNRKEGLAPYVRLFDRCAPSLLAFAREDQARAFTTKYGGTTKRLDVLMREAASPPAEHRHD